MADIQLFVPVPPVDASFSEVFDFSHTYDGYAIHGGVSGTSRFCGGVSDAWEAGRPLEGFELDVLRATLFLQHRSWRFSGEVPEDESEYRFERAVIAAIRTVSGGVVEDHRPITL